MRFAGLAATALLAAMAVPASAAGFSPSSTGGGAVTLAACKVLPHARCGSIERLWDPGNPAAGTVTVGFALVPARDSSKPVLGTVVPHEGGPGYSTTGTASSYAEMYGPLLDRRNLLLVDQRGTGRSEPIDCPALQDLKGDYASAAGACGASLGARADDYSTAWSADDLAAVVDALGLGPVDVYGDSYGTFFAQVYAGRHPEQVRSVVVDSAYPAYGEDAWYATQGPAMRSSFDLVCRRTAACRSAGRPFVPTLEKVLSAVRAKPWRGTAYDADGNRQHVAVDGSTLTTVAFGATYAPAFYRELTAALRSGLSGDRRPLLRLVAEATGGDTDAGPVADYSEGLDAAVACHDYPQLYDMAAATGVRQQQYAVALAARTVSDPDTYGPFTVHEYADSDWQGLDWCTGWPSAPTDNPAGPPLPPGGDYPDVPVLVLSGELDSITTPAEGDLVAAQFPNARHVVVANSFHVTAVGDKDDCAVRIVRSFVRSPSAGLGTRCASRVAPIRALGRFPRALPSSPRAGAVARAAALTVADLQDRWWNSYSGHGVGLRGGTWRYTGDRVVRFRLDRVRLVGGLTVSGTATWDRNAETMTVSLDLFGRTRGHLSGAWDTRTVDARATLSGRLARHPVRVTFPAP